MGRLTRRAGFAGLVALALAPSAPAQSERVAHPVAVSGIVFLDRNGNGVRDPGEPGQAGVAVSDQVAVTTTDAEGRFRLEAAGYGVVFVSPPNGWLVRGRFWRVATAGTELAFPLVATPASPAFAFVHASDTHASPESVPRIRRLRALVDSLHPAFVLITGDLVKDALRVSETEARGYYELIAKELDGFPVPVFTVPGNHEIFGIERHKSLVSPSNPLYGKRMYRSFFGPDYYSFDYGGIHFMGLNTVDYDDLWYSGHVDSVQVRWMQADLAAAARDARVVTFNHIPLYSGLESLSGFTDDGPAPSILRIGGRTYYRHTVRNAEEVLTVLGDRLEEALGGHIHRREFIRYETVAGTRRFAQTAAVVGPVGEPGPMGARSGITLYHVADRRVDDGTFIPLDPAPTNLRP
jgi:hypothetical protein